MLTHLHIKNFTIIDEIDLDFQNGMTVITGETGAGKSIILDALEFLLGSRADSQVVRAGTLRAEIAAHWDIRHNPQAETWLNDHTFDDDSQCIVRRIISKEGPSKNFINGRAATLSQLKELGEALVNIHGQHDQQQLFSREAHRDIVDRFGKLSSITAKVQETFNAWKSVREELDKLKNNTSPEHDRETLLSYQLEELNRFDLDAKRIVELFAEHKRLSNAENIIRDSSEVVQLASEREESNVLALLTNIKHLLENHQHISCEHKAAFELFDSALLQAEQANKELVCYLDGFEMDADRLQSVEKELTQLNDLARKHRITIEELSTFKERLSQELSTLKNKEAHIQLLEKQVVDLEKAYRKNAAELTEKRKKAAENLCKQITSEMQSLHLKGGYVTAEFFPQDHFSPAGLESIEFFVSANAGQPPQPLRKIASGGELSRIALAIQLIITNQQLLLTLIFDEVDVGVGGSTAEMIGKKLRELAKRAQVVCITHLPQVAVFGEQHFKVSKYQTKEQTFTKIDKLAGETRTQEIARMLAGSKITAQTLAHAEEMLAI